MTTDEKYVSIEYETWHNKYKPLEKENERLKEELDSSKISVRITVDSHRLEGYRTIGYVTLSVDKGWSVKIDRWDEVRDEIYNQFNDYEDWRNIYVRRDELHKFLQDQKELTEKLIKEQDKIKNIPRFIRWIFGIRLLK